MQNDVGGSVLSLLYCFTACYNCPVQSVSLSCFQLMDTIADAGVQHFDSDFKEGFWADHWTYNLDLVQSYLQVS